MKAGRGATESATVLGNKGSLVRLLGRAPPSESGLLRGGRHGTSQSHGALDAGQRLPPGRFRTSAGAAKRTGGAGFGLGEAVQVVEGTVEAGADSRQPGGRIQPHRPADADGPPLFVPRRSEDAATGRAYLPPPIPGRLAWPPRSRDG